MHVWYITCIHAYMGIIGTKKGMTILGTWTLESSSFLMNKSFYLNRTNQIEIKGIIEPISSTRLDDQNIALEWQILFLWWDLQYKFLLSIMLEIFSQCTLQSTLTFQNLNKQKHDCICNCLFNQSLRTLSFILSGPFILTSSMMYYPLKQLPIPTCVHHNYCSACICQNQHLDLMTQFNQENLHNPKPA